MTSIVAFMTADHRHCDDSYAEAEARVSEGDWSAAKASWTTFCSDLETHLNREERLLFPAFEAQTGNTQGPTAVMRMEHQQMRALVKEMGEAIGDSDADTFLGLAETLMILMQQHNMKEEQILYPMTDQVLGPVDQLVARLADA